ncbi:MAG: hypothetical protein ABI600_13045 [Luteolibacter sp.]
MIFRSTGFLLFALPVLAGDLREMTEAKSAIIQAPDPPSPWSIGTGVMWRNIGQLSVHPNLQNGPQGSRFFIPPAGAGNLSSFANRTYDNGFVNIGAATPGTGLTTNWGMQSDNQISGDSLNLTLSGGSAQTQPAAANDDEGYNAAPYLELSYLRPIGLNLVAGFASNLSLVRLGGRTGSRMDHSLVSIADHYALEEVIPPSAPYSGSFAGPGPLINNEPTTRDFIFTPDGSNSYQFSNDTDLYSLAFGGEIHWQPIDSFNLGLGTGVVLNLADWTASWNASIPNANGKGTSTVSGANDGEDFLWGLYLKGSAGYCINKQWSVEGFFRYDWNESLSNSVSPSSFELGLTGWSAGLGLIFRF